MPLLQQNLLIFSEICQKQAAQEDIQLKKEHVKSDTTTDKDFLCEKMPDLDNIENYPDNAEKNKISENSQSKKTGTI